MSKILCSLVVMALATPGFASSGDDLPKPKPSEKGLELCTQTRDFSSTVTAVCPSGGIVTATFTESCTESADNCDNAAAAAALCATIKANRSARLNAPKVAELCGPGPLQL